MIVTEAVTAAEVGERLVIVGVGSTVKLVPALGTPPTVTTTLPVVVPGGTGTAILVALQLVGVALVPLNETAPLPCVDPKLAPVIVTDCPTPAEASPFSTPSSRGCAVRKSDFLDAGLSCNQHPHLCPLHSIVE